MPFMPVGKRLVEMFPSSTYLDSTSPYYKPPVLVAVYFFDPMRVEVVREPTAYAGVRDGFVYVAAGKYVFSTMPTRDEVLAVVSAGS